MQGNFFNDAPVRRLASALNKNSAVTGSWNESLFWFKKFDLRRIRKLRADQPFVDFDAVDICCVYVTPMQAMTFHDGILSLAMDTFRDHFVLVFDVTSMQHAAEICHFPELSGETLRLELSFTFPLDNVTGIIVLGE